MGKTLLAFGFYDRESPHVHTVIDAYTHEGWSVTAVHTDSRGVIGKLISLIGQYMKVSKNAGAVVVLFPSHHLMPLAWLLTRFPRKTLILEACISLYDTAVHDRRLVKDGSLNARWLRFVDRLACRLANTVIIDTEAQKKYFVETLNVPAEKIRVIYLEARKDLLPQQRTKFSNDIFDVFFYGTYIPLQGVEHILDAAKIIQEQDPSVRFTLVGAGQTTNVMRKKMDDLAVTNVEFAPFLPLPALMNRLSVADLALGIFGTTDKAARVIPHKVVDAVAAGVPVITRDSPAIRERFAAHPGVILIPAGDPAALATAILRQRAAEGKTL